jgi:hypothetical protein
MLLWFKYFLTVVGEHVPDRWLIEFQAVVNYLMLGRWMREHDLVFDHRVHSREQVWSEMIERIGNRPVLYLEFGVWQGEATRFWAGGLKHPETKFHGFDSFEGLPTAGGPFFTGQFDVQGRIPVINDTRVQFFKGWFDRVLPGYAVPPHELLVINMDADLYPSTIFVLRHLRPWIKPGTLIYFDEMNHVDHEPLAFHEFMKESGIRFKALAGDKPLTHVAFECVR